MPCRDYYDDHPEQYFKDVTEPALRARIAFAESALCMAMNTYVEAMFNETAIRETPKETLFDQVYDHFDYESAGIDKAAFVRWHKEHIRLDVMHREEENKRLLQASIAKLSPKEFAALKGAIISEKI